MTLDEFVIELQKYQKRGKGQYKIHQYSTNGNSYPITDFYLDFDTLTKEDVIVIDAG